MNQYQKNLLGEVEDFITKLFEEKINNHFTFHNLDHTRDVVNSAKKISKHYKLNNDEQFALILAAWFHDTGFCEGAIEKHEIRSKAIARNFLKNKVSDLIRKKVLSCIQSTHLPQKPSTLIEKIICDADLYHLGTDKFKKNSALLKKEREEYLITRISDSEWLEKDIDFLMSHQYFTRYCQKHLEPVSLKWLIQLLSQSCK